jgi:hypothetical protein
MGSIRVDSAIARGRMPSAERAALRANATSDVEEDTMATKESGRRSGRARPRRLRASVQPPKRVRALHGRASKQRGSRKAALNARLRPGRSNARRRAGFVATIGLAIGGLASFARAPRRSHARRKRRLAGLLTVGGAVAASAALKRRRRRRHGHEPPASEPAPGNTTAAATTGQPREGDSSQAAGHTASTQTT